MPNPITLQDIADRCRLSKSMVAKIIRDPLHSKASPATRQRVLDVAKACNYRPNAAAKILATRRCRAIGLLLPADNPAWWRLAVELDAAFRRHGYFMLTGFWHDGEPDNTLRAAFGRLAERGIDAVVAGRSDEVFDNAGIPVLLCAPAAEAAPLAALTVARIEGTSFTPLPDQ